MAWTDSRVFSAFLTDALKNVAAFDLDGDALKVPLFDNSITPDGDASSANSAYGAGQWASGGVGDTPSWPAVGRPLVTPTVVFASHVITIDAPDTESADATTDLAGVFGCQVYDDTLAAPVADQGLCFLYFGGSQSVTNGTFKIIYHALGLITITL